MKKERSLMYVCISILFEGTLTIHFWVHDGDKQMCLTDSEAEMGDS